ncbi:methyltransferase [Corynebacterium otitidis]|uniref:DUF7782 domain-containing protein n=1 Tax=Corynebacterium otitidis TaxID=29321 RepID=UPI000627756E|nr:methyltransferase [Corynebacterium otitidis]KKO82992.1 rRNA methyltransferase [Corynebacterium otitidis]
MREALPGLYQAAPALVGALDEAGLDSDGLGELLGGGAGAALLRGEPAPVRRALRDAEPAAAELVSLVFLHDALPRPEVEDLIGGEVLAALESDGLAEALPGGRVRLLLDARAHELGGALRWVLSDADAAFLDRPAGREHVLGVGQASLSLAGSVPGSPAGRVLDLGAGSGVQALAQAAVAESVVATDVAERCLGFAAATLKANGVGNVELRLGSWFEPVAGERFDRIVANPPFVVGPPEVGHVYRDSGEGLDAATRIVAEGAPKHLSPGGSAHVIGSWAHVKGEPWQARVASWLPARGVAAWVLERDAVDPAAYVSTWLKDENVDPRSAEGERRSSAWLDYLDRQRVEAIGMGFIALKDIGDHASEVVAEELTQPLSGRLGDEVEEYFARAAWLRERSAEGLLDSRFRLRPRLAREDVALADEEAGQGFARAALRLTRTDGPRFSHEVDEELAAILAGLHPQGLSLGETASLYCAARGLDEGQVLGRLPGLIEGLVRHGLVLPAGLGGGAEAGERDENDR